MSSAFTYIISIDRLVTVDEKGNHHEITTKFMYNGWSEKHLVLHTCTMILRLPTTHKFCFIDM